jgi:hypothetical protein
MISVSCLLVRNAQTKSIWQRIKRNVYLLHVENTNEVLYKFNVDRRIVILCTLVLRCRSILLLVLKLKLLWCSELKSYLPTTTSISWLSCFVLGAAVRPHVGPGALPSFFVVADHSSHTPPNASYCSITCPRNAFRFNFGVVTGLFVKHFVNIVKL